MATPFDRLPRRIRHALFGANIKTIPDLLTADRTSLGLSTTDRARLEYLVEQNTPTAAEPPSPAVLAPAPASPAELARTLPELLTTAQAAAFLQVGRRTVATMCADGRIVNAWKLGDDWRIPRAAVLALLTTPEATQP